MVVVGRHVRLALFEYTPPGFVLKAVPNLAMPLIEVFGLGEFVKLLVEVERVSVVFDGGSLKSDSGGLVGQRRTGRAD